LSGRGGDQNSQTAIAYYTYAASQGYVPAQYILGILYANGNQVARDVVEAHAWLSLAAGQKHEPAVKALQKLKEEMTLSDVDKARQRLIDLQKNTLGQMESPLKEQQDSVADGDGDGPRVRPIRRRRRR